MLPVIASVGGFSVSSFGLFLLLAFVAAFFVIWRIIRLYDLDQEKTVDLYLLTILGGIIGARAYFVLFHLGQYFSFNSIFNIYRYPGMSFWGGLIFGGLTLFLLSRRMKINFWQAADIALVGTVFGLVFSSIGCLLGSCEYGNPSNWPIAVSLVGVIGKRFPIQIIQTVLVLGIYFYLWKAVLRFHFDGQIAGVGLLLIGLMKLVTEPFRATQITIGGVSISYLFSLALVIIGIWLQYSRTKKSLRHDLAYSLSLFSQSNRRKQALLNIRRWWYNLYILVHVSTLKWKRNLFKILHVKSNPTKF